MAKIIKVVCYNCQCKAILRNGKYIEDIKKEADGYY